MVHYTPGGVCREELGQPLYLFEQIMGDEAMPRYKPTYPMPRRPAPYPREPIPFTDPFCEIRYRDQSTFLPMNNHQFFQ